MFGRVRKGAREICVSDKVSLSVTGFDPLSCIYLYKNTYAHMYSLVWVSPPL